MRVTHAEKDRQRYPRPSFMSEREAALFMSPSVHISRDMVMMAIEQVERLCEWLEEKMFDAKYPARIRRD